MKKIYKLSIFALLFSLTSCTKEVDRAGVLERFKEIENYHCQATIDEIREKGYLNVCNRKSIPSKGTTSLLTYTNDILESEVYFTFNTDESIATCIDKSKFSENTSNFYLENKTPMRHYIYKRLDESNYIEEDTVPLEESMEELIYFNAFLGTTFIGTILGDAVFDLLKIRQYSPFYEGEVNDLDIFYCNEKYMVANKYDLDIEIDEQYKYFTDEFPTTLHSKILIKNGLLKLFSESSETNGVVESYKIECDFK